MDCGNNRKLMNQCITEKGLEYIKKIMYNEQVNIFNNPLYLRSSQNIVNKYIKFNTHFYRQSINVYSLWLQISSKYFLGLQKL